MNFTYSHIFTEKITKKYLRKIIKDICKYKPNNTICYDDLSEEDLERAVKLILDINPVTGRRNIVYTNSIKVIEEVHERILKDIKK